MLVPDYLRFGVAETEVIRVILRFHSIVSTITIDRQNGGERSVQMPSTPDTESIVRDIKRKTRKKYTAEEKIRIVLEGLRGEESIAAICRREGISPNLYYRWSKEFLEAGKKRLLGDTQREATSFEVTGLKQENDQLKQLVAELSLKNRVLKKSLHGME